MSSPRLEHVNVTVRDPDAAARTFVEAFGWHVRWAGESKFGGRTVHVGNEDTYVALYAHGEPAPAAGGDTYHTHLATNHVGVVVDDLGAVEARAVEAGYRPHSHGDYEPGRRFYFEDEQGLEIEVVSYS